jgi:Xaa-Pro dipeptidase
MTSRPHHIAGFPTAPQGNVKQASHKHVTKRSLSSQRNENIEFRRGGTAARHAVADLVAYPEYPGVVPPFAVLAGAVGVGSRKAGHTTAMTYARLSAAATALSTVELAPTDLVTVARYVKEPGEVALHQEAARITDVMLAEGVTLVTDAIDTGGELPSEAELAAHVGRVGTSTMYAEHTDVVVVSMLAGGLVYAGANSSYPHGLPSGYRLRPGDTFMLSLGCAVGGRFVEGERTFVLGLGRYLRHRQGHGIGLGMHEPPWLEDGDATVLEPGMIVSNEPGIYVPGHAGYRISDSMLVTEDGSRPLTSYPRSLDDCVIPV